MAVPTPTAGESRSADNPSTNLPADSRRITINLDDDGPRDITIAAGRGRRRCDRGGRSRRRFARWPRTTRPTLPAYTGLHGDVRDPRPAGAPVLPADVGIDRRELARRGHRRRESPATGISLPAGTKRFVIEVNRDGPHVVELTGALAERRRHRDGNPDAVRAISPNRASNAAAFSAFNATYENGAGPRNPSLRADERRARHRLARARRATHRLTTSPRRWGWVSPTAGVEIERQRRSASGQLADADRISPRRRGHRRQRGRRARRRRRPSARRRSSTRTGSARSTRSAT